MGHDKKVSCILCKQSDETTITGALSTKEQVTAHQNCLLFSSGIYCRDSPQFDDLFGFSVKDVLDEVKRGSKLMCNKCKNKGATAGCEVKRCKKSYHYPCAIQEGAQTVEDVDKGKFGLYCFQHCQKLEENISSVNGAKSQTSEKPSEAGPAKVHCVACEKRERNISLECTSDGVHLLYCDKHGSESHQRNTNGDVPAARLSAYNSDSDSSTGSMKHSPMKRVIDREEEPPAKRKSEAWNRIITDDSSDSDGNQPETDIAIFAPLESDIDGESQVTRGNTESSSWSPSAGNQHRNKSQGEVQDEDETDAESESLLPLVGKSTEAHHEKAQTVLTAQPSGILLNEIDNEGSVPEPSPVLSPRRHAAQPVVSQRSSAGPSPSPDLINPRSILSSPLRSSSAISHTPAASANPPSHPEPSLNSTSFWKSCNAAGCTQAIFADFINEINEISSKIQSGQADQEDYDLALRVMEASGKLAELVTKRQKELERKLLELHEAAASMMKVVSTLRK